MHDLHLFAKPLPVRTLILLPMLLCMLFSCHQDNKTAQIRSIPVDPNIERLLVELTNRFPQLPKSKGRPDCIHDPVDL
jgi:hypothetical protein